jgi:hypothetical protein
MGNFLKSLWACLCFSGLFTSAIERAEAQGKHAVRVVAGHVFDSSGAVVAGATVTLAGQPEVHTKTDATGGFRLEYHPSEKSELTISAPGFATLHEANVSPSGGDISARLSPLVVRASSTTASASPGPCELGAPRGAGSAAPALSTCPSPTPKTIGSVQTVGRKVNLVGTATAASEGTISQEDIATRPALHAGELLEQIPGLVVSQHSGEGKANQYYLRGFQLDHGTDLESTVDGIPINLPTHAHGQGYSDINWLMPELVSYVEFKKGTYYADGGDFSTAGAYHLYFRDTIAPVSSFGLGDFGYDRFFTAGSHASGPGSTFLSALEIYHDNNSLMKPDEYRKFNGLLRYSRVKGNDVFTVTGSGYSGTFDSTDQIPQRLVDDGELSRFGYFNPTDGGNTSRYALSANWQHQDPNGVTKFSAYTVDYSLDLFSDFTYYYFDANNYYNEAANPITCNVAFKTCTPNGSGAPRASNYSSYCPAYTAPADAAPHSLTPAAYNFSCGDQREQQDKRFFEGANVSRTFVTPGSNTIVGAGFTNYNIPEVGLFLVDDRNRLPGGTLSNDHVVERPADIFIQSELRFGSKLRLSPGIRADLYAYSNAAYDPANSGSGTAGMVSPKMNAAYALNHRSELYLDFGDSFHSNDVRSVTYVDDPQTRASFDSTGAAVLQNPLLNRSVGEEVGYRFSGATFSTTSSLWELYQANELIFDGDHGTTSIGGPSQRKGVELSNTFRPRPWLTFDTDLATSTARFLDDPLHQGTGVPESLNSVVSLGATADTKRYATSLRMRYFGPRTLDTQGDAKSPPSTVWNAQYTAKLTDGRRFSFDIFNLFNADVADVTYYYASWVPRDAANRIDAADPAINPALGGAGVRDDHFHPTGKRTVRATFALPL